MTSETEIFVVSGFTAVVRRNLNYGSRPHCSVSCTNKTDRIHCVFIILVQEKRQYLGYMGGIQGTVLLSAMTMAFVYYHPYCCHTEGLN